jgi:hypothetical protein
VRLLLLPPSVAVADSWMFCPSVMVVGIVTVWMVGGRLLTVRLTVARRCPEPVEGLEICPSLLKPR